MRQLLIAILRKTPLYFPVKNWAEKRLQEKKLKEWESAGRPVPPPHAAKQNALKAHAKKFGLKVLVETGTFRGDMVEALKRDFDRVYSIELSQELYSDAKNRFRGEEKIELIQGDSGVELGSLMNRIEQPTLFWLDGHYSAGVTASGANETAIYDELEHIFNAQDLGHVIIIDDARLFGTDPAYPSVQELSDYIRSKRPDAVIAIENDSIRITPGQ